MRIVSLNAGRPQLVVAKPGTQPYSTAINKKPVTGRVELNETGLVGDFQADQHAHGGPDKALCVYPHEHYGYIGQRLGAALAIPSFGENLTTQGLLEDEVRIGDTFEVVGTDVALQVSQPREPCFKLARKHHSGDLLKWIHDTGYCGFYVRVLHAGSIEAGLRLVRTDRGETSATVFEVLKAMFRPDYPVDRIAQFADTPGISPGWRRRLKKRAAEARQGRLPFVDVSDEE